LSFETRQSLIGNQQALISAFKGMSGSAGELLGATANCTEILRLRTGGSPKRAADHADPRRRKSREKGMGATMPKQAHWQHWGL
jgi:hypothetical protein